MERIVRNVREIEAADRSALEQVIGQRLSENQQVIFEVITLKEDEEREPASTAAGDIAALPDWCDVYRGLSESEIAEVEAVAILRADLSRPSP